MSNALKQGLRALEYLSEAPRSAADVARHLGVDRTTGWRILQVLIEHGWVSQGAGSAPFSLDVTHVYGLAGKGHEHQALPGLVAPTLTRIRDTLGESAVLGVPSGRAMVYLVYVPSLQAVMVREAVGWVRPMHASALGKAYLSALGEPALQETVTGLDFQGATERAVKSPIELLQVVREARERGYATDLEECVPGVICVAVPVFVGQERLLIGALGINGPRDRLMMMGVERVASVIQREVAQLEAHFVQAGDGVAIATPSPAAANNGG